MITDAFTGADGTGLAAYSANWAYTQGAGTSFHLRGNAVATIQESTVICARRVDGTFPVTHTASLTITTVGSDSIGVAVRCQAGVPRFYGFYFGGPNVYLFYQDGASFFDLGTVTRSVVPGDVLSLEVTWNGSTNTLTPRINGSTTGCPTAATHAALTDGAPGICGYNNTGTPGTTRGDSFACTDEEGVTLPAPIVTSVTPTSGATTGGTAVTIAGANFVTGATVRVGGTLAGSVSVVTATTITATTPAHAAGAVAVVVMNPDAQSGTLASAFTYISTVPPPARLSPEEAVVERLLQIPEVTAIVGTRVWLVLLPQSPVTPCVRVQQVSQIDEGQMLRGGGGSRGWARVQVDAVADMNDGGNGYRTARELTDAIHGDGRGESATGLLGWRGEIPPLTITGIVSILDGVADFAPDELRQIRIRRDYQVWFAQD